jgi:class 3 adenylate cyclase/pimeloyl-ACP methyl ester carboxylesterase
MRPETRYARSEDGFVAYQVLGEGPVDFVIATELLSHCEHRWDEPSIARSLERLAAFSRLIMFDKRGTGLSDPVPVDRLPTLEARARDLDAVLDAVGAARPVLAGFSEGGVDAIFFAATRPERVSSLILYATWPRFFADDSYPIGWQREQVEPLIDAVLSKWGQGQFLSIIAPSTAGDERLRTWWAGYERLAASPGVAAAFLRIALDIDVRALLPAITAPTLVIHRAEDVFSPVAHGRYLGANIAEARYVELTGVDHPFFIGDADTVIDAIEEFVTGSRPVPLYDRVLTTILFVDIVGSTERAAHLGDRSWRDLLEAFYSLVRRQFERFHGREVDSAGDGVFAAFDGPARGVACACAIRDAVRGLGLEVRAGLHTGECELIGGKIGGLAVHIAARIAALAEPNEVLVSRTIRDLTAGSGVRFQERGAHRLKGIPDEWQLYRADR